MQDKAESLLNVAMVVESARELTPEEAATLSQQHTRTLEQAFCKALVHPGVSRALEPMHQQREAVLDKLEPLGYDRHKVRSHLISHRMDASEFYHLVTSGKSQFRTLKRNTPASAHAPAGVKPTKPRHPNARKPRKK